MAITSRSGSVKGGLYLMRRVPKRYASVEPRKLVWVSLHTDSMSVAKSKEAAVWEQMVAAWEAKLAGDTTDAEQRFAAAQDLAQARGFRYLRADPLAPAAMTLGTSSIPTSSWQSDTPQAPLFRPQA